MAIIDLIQWTDERPDELVHRVPERGSGEFVLGSQLVVRENQSAVFVRDGRALDVFEPGRHTLSTNNIPLLVELMGIPFGGDSPFTAEVFFASLREFTDLKWGTVQPLTYRDSELGLVRLRAHGTYSIRITDPQLFITYIVGTQSGYSVGDIEGFLRSIVINQFNALLGDMHTSILDLPGLTLNLANAARLSLAGDFERLGLKLMTFQLTAVTPPEEVQKRIDERSGMAAIGDMATYTQFQTAQAMRDAAQNPGGGGAAGIGVGLGAGAAMGQAMANAMPGFGTSGHQQAAPTTPCPKCNAQVALGAKFCSNCGASLLSACAECGTPNSANAKFCEECGNALAQPTGS